ncbi:hypothetical protein VTK26DRAFT_3256 [Humicola hyalothermophila]
MVNGTPAPYGRACTNCARAKCRCIYRNDGADCERCHRLKKECVPSVSVRKRNGKRAHMSRAAQLEAKLEDLVTLLRHQTAPADNKGTSPSDAALNGSVSTPPLSCGHSNTSHTTENSPQSPAIAALPPQRPDCTRVPLPVVRGTLLGNVFDGPVANPARSPLEVPGMPPCIYQPTPSEAAESLVVFRKYMLIFLPFVHLPPTMTSDRLRETYPFMWFNIMTVTCKHVDRRLVMSEAIKKHLAHRMIIEHDKSLDLLLGLLVLLGWTHYHIKREKPILSVLASLAKALVFDLGLNKIPSESYISACFGRSFHPTPREKTLEERRAVLACFYVTSQISHSMKRLDALSWTSHMEEFLQSLSVQREWEGDDLLVAQVKIQLIVEHLTRATSQSTDNVLPNYVLSALGTQLQNIKAQLPLHLQQNDTILNHISYTELAIQEAALARPKPPINGSMPDLQRFEAMEACLSAVKDWFDRHFSIPSFVYVGMTFSYWCHMCHCLLSLYRLSVRDEPGWDRRSVRNKVDLLDICDRLKAGFEELATRRRMDSGATTEEDEFVKFAKMLRGLKSSWAAELATVDGNPGPNPDAHAEVSVDSGADGLNVPFFQPEDPDSWMAGLFDINWEL